MAKKKIGIEGIAKAILSLSSSEDLQKLICGTYSDGTPKSVIDSIHGEVLSPKDKKKKIYKKKKVKHKKIKL